MEWSVASGYPSPHGLHASEKKASPWFVGNYIHDSSAISWHLHKKQRFRQRAGYHRTGKKAAAAAAAAHQEERCCSRDRPLSESGYDTVGEQLSQSNGSKIEAGSKGGDKGTPHDASNISDNSTLQRLVKDLHRCDVFIARSLSALNEVSFSRIPRLHCELLYSPLHCTAALHSWREGTQTGHLSAAPTHQSQRE